MRLDCWFLVAMLAPVIAFAQKAEFHPPPGQVTTSWVGNSFGGNGGPNGFGYWVQDSAEKIKVTPDGTVIAGCSWDEAGRCVGLYKDGRCSRILLKHEGAAETAWGWNTGNHAIAFSGDQIFVANTGKRLLRFRWTPGDCDSAKYVDEVGLDESPVAMDCRKDALLLVYKQRIETRTTADLKPVAQFQLSDVQDLAVAEDRTLWAIRIDKVLHLAENGTPIGQAIAGIGRPSSLAFSPSGLLIVCDAGLDQQVKLFDVTKDSPSLIRTLGEKGGIMAGTPGAVAPAKLFAPRGAGADAAGNLYVAMGFNAGPAGNLVLRAFSPNGNPKWELMNLAFVDTFGFDPDADGSQVYSRTARLGLNLSESRPGAEWRLDAITIDPNRLESDPRSAGNASVYLRRPAGRRILYTIGQYAGGYDLYTFDEPNGQIASRVDSIHPTKQEGEQWAWNVDANADIWNGDAPQRTIRRYKLGGWSDDGKPRYDWSHPQIWPWPADFELIRRAVYIAESDTLYLTGYLKGQTIDSWGVVGKTCRRYDKWASGHPTVAWTNPSLPVNPEGSDEHKPLTPCALSVAAEYLFLGIVKPDDNRQYVHILKAADGSYVGSLFPGEAVGNMAGWEDMPYAVQALRRSNGEYLILAEDDARGKNLLYRWKP